VLTVDMAVQLMKQLEDLKSRLTIDIEKESEAADLAHDSGELSEMHMHRMTRSRLMTQKARLVAIMGEIGQGVCQILDMGDPFADSLEYITDRLDELGDQLDFVRRKMDVTAEMAAASSAVTACPRQHIDIPSFLIREDRGRKDGEK